MERCRLKVDKKRWTAGQTDEKRSFIGTYTHTGMHRGKNGIKNRDGEMK